MKKIIMAAAVNLCLVSIFTVASFGYEVVWENIGKENTKVKAVLVRPDNPEVIYFGSERGLYGSEDGGKNWKNISAITGQNKRVNFLYFDPTNTDCVYAASASGLFTSLNQGRDWRRIFKGKNSWENDCTALAVLSDIMYLGTKAGFFVSKDKGRSWHKLGGKLANAHVLAVKAGAKNSGCVYAASTQGVYKIREEGDYWESISVSHAVEDEDNIQDYDEDSDEQVRVSSVRDINIDPNRINYLYLATSQGIYQSSDAGNAWESLPSFGLLSSDIKLLLVLGDSSLYAASKTGIYTYQGQRWLDLSSGLNSVDITSLDFDNRGNIYAACQEGLFRANIKSISNSTSSGFLSLYTKNEPAISKVQEAAIRYAEVQPQKIQQWRRQAAKRAILPRLTIGIDRDIDRTVSNSIWGTYGTTNGSAGKYYVGPDDETRYDNRGWGVALTWELSDLIWSDSQTSIDTRSRLMVQLRQDVLDEVTKTYFERLRVKMELDSIALEDRKKRVEKELRLEELSASLDALTGGYFSASTTSLASR